jgi:hypothetical protein
MTPSFHFRFTSRQPVSLLPQDLSHCLSLYRAAEAHRGRLSDDRPRPATMVSPGHSEATGRLGERAYGETYSQALEESDYVLGTLQQAKFVASRIEPLRRLKEVSWGAHQEVATLPPKQQDKLLAEAARDNLTVRVEMSRRRDNVPWAIEPCRRLQPCLRRQHRPGHSAALEAA